MTRPSFAPETFGSEVGNGMALLTQNWVSTQNALEQQRQARQQAADQLALQQQQAAQQASYQNASLAQNQQQLDLQGARDKAAQVQTEADRRQKDFLGTVKGDFDGEKAGLVAAMTAARAAGDSTSFQHAQDRLNKLNSLMKTVNLSTQDDTVYWPARQALYEFIGGSAAAPQATSTAPTQSTQAPTPSAVPSINYTFPTSTPPVAHGDAVANGDTGQQGPPAAVQAPTAQPSPQAAHSTLPGTSAPVADPSRYTDLRQIPIAELVQMNPDDLERQFPGVGSSWWGSHKVAYDAAQEKARSDAADARLTNWKAQYGELSKNPDLTPDQRTAMINISTLLSKPLLTSAEQTTLAQQMSVLDPVVYTRSHWTAIVGRHDDAEISSMYDWYLQKNPDVVQGFPIEPYKKRLAAAAEKDATSTALVNAQVVNVNAQTDTEDALRPGKVETQNDVHDLSVVNTDKVRAETKGVEATTDRTIAQTLGDKTDAGVKLLATLSAVPTDLTYVQIAKQMPGLLSQLKQTFGLKDAGAENLIRQAQAVYAQGYQGKDLENQLAQSKILTEGATRAGIIATTANTVSTTRARDAKLQPELDLLNAQIREAELRGQDTASLIRQRNALLPGQLVAQVDAHAASQASAALSWANVENIRVDNQDQAQRTQQFIENSKSQIGVDNARIKQITAQTLLTRATNPNDPLYRSELGKAKAGDPLADVRTQAGMLLSQARQASDLASKYNTQINSLTAKYKTPMGTVDLSRITPADKVTLDHLTDERDHQMQVAANRTRTSDQMVLDGLSKTTPAVPTGMPQPNSIAPAQYQNVAAGVTPGPTERPQETRFLNALRGAEGNPNYGLVTESTGNTQQDRATVLDKLRRWGSEYATNTGHFAGMNPSKAGAMQGGDFTPAFVQAFSKVYAPLGVANDPKNLNANHTPNMLGYMVAGGWNPGGTTPKVTATSTAAKAPAALAFKANPTLEASLADGVRRRDPDAINGYGAALEKAGYSEAQIKALIKKAQGG